jgi:hypothetical protein
VASSSTEGPQLSVILPTDTWATIRPVVERLRRQTIADRIEVVFVTPDPDALTDATTGLEGLSSFRVVRVPTLVPLWKARAAGVRAARAPLIVLGETHAYAHPTWAGALVGAHAGSRPIVVPAFGNANPDGALSWAAYLSDYGAWGEGLERGEIRRWPGQNSAYSRAALLELGDGLEAALSRGDALWTALRAGGHGAWFEPDARIDHLNVARPLSWVAERFLAGLLIAGGRASGWLPARRLAYAAAAPLIPAVLTWRTLSGWRRAVQRQRVPFLTLPAMLAGNAVQAIGETVGYVRGRAGTGAEEAMTRFEIRKVDYATPHPR